MIIVTIARDYPHQALWSILAVVNSRQEKRQNKGKSIINRLRATTKNSSGSSTARELLNPAVKLVSVFINFCNTTPPRNRATCDLTRDLNFDMSSVPCKLAMPVRQMLDISLPATPSEVKHHSPFQENVYIYGRFYFILVTID
ncbi:protein kinase MEC1 [Sugiyamaella lignohabitans]|uniref:Protein kinase MEC1 n=1 Tax=Sugiyamaella lignohabitans TaxID=796027 RepID=A0A167EPA6_9ASCO|nr:protein kinase MEC1 [Sugiyamaella lignohabitans]ANB14311.1 protein kinase MEC1 [Sugiyamaella lignohabitans]